MAEQRLSGRTPVIAVSLAAVALVTVLIAVIVVATRGGGTAAAAKPVDVEDLGPIKHRVAATEVVRLDRDTLEATTDASGVSGVKVTDAALRVELGLGPTDVITAISGRAIKRQFDVYDALLGASMMNATALYVELIRDGKPVLVRWELDGDLRTARTGSKRPPRTSTFPTSPLSPLTALPDPLIDTVKKIDDFTYEVPRSTVDAMFGTSGTAPRGVRVVPSMKNGQPNGFKLYSIRAGTIFDALGFRNGDTVQSINGQPLDSPSAALDLYDKLKNVDTIRIDLERRRRPEALKITVTR
jgi:S1-C subfamily serine protease